jgi:serine phosphatase RsbU (regulator of sigma subunit)/pSer/pThr/pTyr-binding forkhead associated (FHA) protein
MAHLLIRRGPNAGHRIRLMKEAMVIGRSPDCDLTVPSPSISRQHARLVLVDGQWQIEDMRSRNGTYVNGRAIEARTPLAQSDRIRICDFEVDFLESNIPTATTQLPSSGLTLKEETENSSNLTAMATHGSKVLEIQPAENLRTILQVSNRISTTLEMDQLLPRIADNLFQLFPQGDRCFVVLQDDMAGKPVQELVRTRKKEDEASARFSKSVVQQCIETGQALLSEDISQGALPPSQSSLEMRIRSILCTPLVNANHQAIGAVQLDTQDVQKRFTAHDLRLFIGVVNQAAIAIQNARLYQEMQKREQVERDLELAAQVQQSILPESAPQLPGWQFFQHYSSALEVGGDYFDFIPLPRGRWAVALGDVAGKSVPAAILMAKLSSDVRTCLLNEPEPAAAISALNRTIYRNLRQTDRWVTLAVAVLDSADWSLVLVNAGHCTPLLYRYAANALQEAIPNSASGVPLGVSEAPDYGSWRIVLDPGDTLLMFTDGVPDALNAKEQQFKVQGIYGSLKQGGPFTAETLGQRIVKEVDAHASGHRQYDDITLLSFGRVR